MIVIDDKYRDTEEYVKFQQTNAGSREAQEFYDMMRLDG